MVRNADYEEMAKVFRGLLPGIVQTLSSSVIKYEQHFGNGKAERLLFEIFRWVPLELLSLLYTFENSSELKMDQNIAIFYTHSSVLVLAIAESSRN